LKNLSILGFLVALATVGCAAAVPPQELANARNVYDRASKGPATSLNPTDLHTAKEALSAAERSFDKQGDTQVTRDLSYVAARRAETAESRARTMQTTAEKEAAIKQMHAGTSAELAHANDEIESKDKALQTQGAALTSEVQRRKEAEKRAAQAAADLAKFASVKQDPRGMIITLSGEVLFQSNKSELFPGAQLKLDGVAKALTEQDPNSTMVVEGHTDSQGMAANNQVLSEKRAQAVRTYLVAHGVAADRITAVGFGQGTPIAPNNTPEGRANNRRVEIVVKPRP
jgi:outer membrane protein OmpA-like peptidoglycan-associated protein